MNEHTEMNNTDAFDAVLAGALGCGDDETGASLDRMASLVERRMRARPEEPAGRRGFWIGVLCGAGLSASAFAGYHALRTVILDVHRAEGSSRMELRLDEDTNSGVVFTDDDGRERALRVPAGTAGEGADLNWYEEPLEPEQGEGVDP